MGMLENVLVPVLALLVTLGILVTFHEFGHFWVARRCGVKVERFSIGFGKPLLRWRRGETEYVIAALPLGGYVKMLGENDANIPAHERARAFSSKPLAQRAAIVAAGPLANFLLAAVLYWLMFLSGVSGVAPVIGDVRDDSPAAVAGVVEGDEIVAVDGKATPTWQDVRLALLNRLGETGRLDLRLKGEGDVERAASIPLNAWLIDEAEPDVLGALGMEPFRLDIPPRLGEILPEGRAAAAGLQPGDLIVAVDGEPVAGWLAWIEVVRANPETDLRVQVEREGAPLTVDLRPERRSDDSGSFGYIGAGVQQPDVLPTLPPEMNRELRYTPWEAVPQALSETWDNIVFVLVSIKKMIVGLISVQNLGGPITIAQVAGETAVIGLEYYLGFLAVLSISLGVLNLLPIPVLDGGHLFYYLVEAAIRRPVPERIQEMGMQVGILLIMCITLIAFYNDVNRLF